MIIQSLLNIYLETYGIKPFTFRLIYILRHVRNISGKYESSDIVFSTILYDEEIKENVFYVNG